MDVSRNVQCENVVNTMIDLGREEEKWKEQERGQEVKIGQWINNEGGRKFKREMEKPKE